MIRKKIIIKTVPTTPPLLPDQPVLVVVVLPNALPPLTVAVVVVVGVGLIVLIVVELME
jgi:ABC-type nitrate/sulfonate/bicarbonate transport system permease component